MRRIALLSDVHGNLPALDAVLEAIDALAIGEVYCLGDVVGYGPDPSAVIARIRERGISTVRGNYDDGVGNRRGECGCHYTSEEARRDGAASYAFTDGALDGSEHQWLAALPDRLHVDVEGARMVLVHGSPRRLNEYLTSDRTDALLLRLAEESDADIVCIGHTHVAYHRAVESTHRGTIHYVNVGSVGKPKDGDPRAGWVEFALGQEREVLDLTAEDAHVARVARTRLWVAATVHRVSYDPEPVAAKMRRLGMPERLGRALVTGE